MEHSAEYREKQYRADRSHGHHEFWRAIFAEVRAEVQAEKNNPESLIPRSEDLNYRTADGNLLPESELEPRPAMDDTFDDLLVVQSNPEVQS